MSPPFGANGSLIFTNHVNTYTNAIPIAVIVKNYTCSKLPAVFVVAFVSDIFHHSSLKI